MTDRELLERAAKAAGVEWNAGSGGEMLVLPHVKGMAGYRKAWHPLTDDGDAFRLAVALGIIIDCSRPSAHYPFQLRAFVEKGSGPEATRRAIVRAAASLA